MVVDAISDMLTRVRNAGLAKKATVHIPNTKITKSLALALVDNGFICSVTELEVKYRNPLILSLKYFGNPRKAFIENIQRISKPGLRVYSSSKRMPKALGGFGVIFVSTSHGVMTDKQARRGQLGGELLCNIW